MLTDPAIGSRSGVGGMRSIVVQHGARSHEPVDKAEATATGSMAPGPCAATLVRLEVST